LIGVNQRLAPQSHHAHGWMLQPFLTRVGVVDLVCLPDFGELWALREQRINDGRGTGSLPVPGSPTSAHVNMIRPSDGLLP
jgi:hypothetical protein